MYGLHSHEYLFGQHLAWNLAPLGFPSGERCEGPRHLPGRIRIGGRVIHRSVDVESFTRVDASCSGSLLRCCGSFSVFSCSGTDPED